MISYLFGKLVQKSPTELVVDVNGVGYHVNIPLSTFEQLENADGDVKILTYLHVREDIMQLYGFATEAEREFFRLLISVSGVGPKMAQGILSGLSTPELRQAILDGNLAALTSISGVGRKTAERLVIELRDKLGKTDVAESVLIHSSKQLKVRAEAVVALMSLGYTRQSAEKALLAVMKEATEKELSVEELIKRALREATK
jgi:Holliday junction DNA helicase RuvA